MELFPIIYTSLLIAAGLFVVTVIVSYVSYKVRQSNADETETDTPQIDYLKKTKPVDLKAGQYKKEPSVKRDIKEEHPGKIKYDSDRPGAGSSHESEQRLRSRNERREEQQVKQKTMREDLSRKTQAGKRIEIVKDLKPGTGKDSGIKSTVKESGKNLNDIEKNKKNIDETKNRKKLKSINDDPLDKYSDSSDDDLHPLKTDD